MTSQSETEYFENFLRIIDIIDSNDNRREEIQDAFNQLNRQMNAIDRNTFQDFNRICPRIIQNLKEWLEFVRKQEVGTNVSNVANTASTVTGAALCAGAILFPPLLVPGFIFGGLGAATGISTSIANGATNWNTGRELEKMINEHQETLDSIRAVIKSIENFKQILEKTLAEANTNHTIDPFQPLTIAVLCYDAASFAPLSSFAIQELRIILQNEIARQNPAFLQLGERAFARAGGRTFARLGRLGETLGKIYQAINNIFGYAIGEIAGIAGQAIEAGARAGARVCARAGAVAVNGQAIEAGVRAGARASVRAGGRTAGRVVGRAIGQNILGPVIAVGFTIEHFINGNPMREGLEKQIQAFEALHQISRVFTMSKVSNDERNH